MDKVKVDLDPSLWIILKKTRDDENRRVMRFKGITDDKLEVSEAVEEGWLANRVGRDWKEMEILI